MLHINKTKKIALSVAAVSAVALPSVVAATTTLISANDSFAAGVPSGFNDQNFYNCVLAEFQSEYPDETVASSGLTDSQLAKIKTLDCNGANAQDNQKITDLTGLQKMYELYDLKLHSNKISAINVASNTDLVRIDVSDNQLSSIDVRNNTNLKTLALYDNNISSLDISKNTELTQLAVYRNKLTSIDATNNTKLLQIYAQNNSLASINTSNCTALALLVLSDNKLTSVNLRNNPELTMVFLHNNLLTTLDVSRNTALELLSVHENNLTELTVSSNPELKHLYVDNILVTAGIEDMSLSSGEAEFDLTGLKFISDEGNTVINNTNNYAYNSANKKLTVSNFAATGGFAVVSPKDASKELSDYKNFKLKLGKVDQSDPGDDDDADDTVVPDTSAETGKTTDDGVKTPDTGSMTREDKDSISFISYLSPVLIITMVSILFYACGRKILIRKRIGF